MAYIYEYIRTQGYEPLYLDEHYARLDALARGYFFAPLKISLQELYQAIIEALRGGQFSPSMMNVVYVQYCADGSVEVRAEWTIYNSFSLRALHPQSYLCRVSGELITNNTSVRASHVEFHQTTALATNRGVAIWATEQDEVVAIDGAPVIAVFEDEVRFLESGSGVEFELAYQVATKLKHNVVRGVVKVEDLPRAKELLYVDYRGVTALQQLYDSTLYMDITAEKIAARIAEMERA